MRHALSQQPWKDLLPDGYQWLEKVQAKGVKDASGALHVVAVQPDSDPNAGPGAVTLDAPELDTGVKQKLSDAVGRQGWTASGTPFSVDVDGESYLLVPLSTVKTSRKQIARQWGLDAARGIAERNVERLAFCATAGMDPLDAFDGLAAGFYGNTGFKGDRKSKVDRLPKEVLFLGSTVDTEAAQRQVEFSKATALTRFVQDAPANYLDPLKFAEIAEDIAKNAGVKCRVMDRKEMEKAGMNSALSVADGGRVEPRTIIFEIEGEDNSSAVSLVGKGLTFDAGGISLKPASGMEEMKYDMSGGAAVLGAAHYFGAVKPPVKVICAIGAAENMPSGTATKPGDIVRARNGKTVEVLNTDAEGRLVLADVLNLMSTEYKPDLMIDAATLTGAVLHGLGSAGAACLSNDRDTASYVISSGEDLGEPVWELPLWPELENEIKSDVADLRNIAKPNVKAGTIIGGVFLREFVGDTKWAHLDIAGAGWNCQATGYPASGGAAYGLRTMVASCLRFKR